MLDFGTTWPGFGVFHRNDRDTGPHSPERHSAQPLGGCMSNKVLAEAARQFGA
jgi:hypothetical protein